MAKMTDLQRALLEAAAQRDDGATIAPENMSKGAGSKVGASLVDRKLMPEIRQKGDLPIWRINEDGRKISLVLTRAGRAAISVTEGAGRDRAASGSRRRSPKKSTSEVKIRDEGGSIADSAPSGIIETATSDPAPASATVAHAPVANAQPRVGSKQALLVEMISKPEGATIDALIDATGWLPHTTRAALTGLRKRGFAIQRVAQQDAPSIYVIEAVAAGSQAKAADSRR